MTDLQPGLTAKNASKRPAYLVIALLLVWMVGLLGAAEGCQTIDVVHHPDSVRSALDHIENVDLTIRQEALIDSILHFPKIATPLAVGRLLLGSLLTFTAGLTLLGREHARKIAQQAIIVYALFLPLDYVLRQPMRTMEFDSVAEKMTLKVNEVTALPEDVRLINWWACRAALGFQLMVLTLSVFAMTRPGARAFFRAAAATNPASDRDL